MKTCNLSLLLIPETEKNALSRPEPLSESYTENTYKPGIFVNSLLQFPTTTENGGHCPGLCNDLTRGFSDAIDRDGFAIDRKVPP